MHTTADFIKLAIALLAIVDVPGNIPMFLQKTGNMSASARRMTALVAGAVTFLILLTFAFAGETVLSSFGITIHAFRILGGLVILMIALMMLGLIPEPSASGSDAQANNPVLVGIFPMSVPLFAGPGAITTVMIYAHAEQSHPGHNLFVIGILGSVCLAIALGLVMASFLGPLMTPVTQQVLNRLLGMIVGALGVEFILEGVQGFFVAPL